MSDFTYVENVSHANICAEEALSSRMVSISGKVTLVSVSLLTIFFPAKISLLECESSSQHFAGVSHH